jgi:uncharacterized protein (UPF0276 family)
MNAAREFQFGLGIGWRPELAWFIEQRADISFVEVLADNIIDCPQPKKLLYVIDKLRDRGTKVVLHSIGLSLGGAELPDRHRLDAIARLAKRLKAQCVSDHIAFVRAGGIEAGHLLPVPRTVDCLEILAENIVFAQSLLPVPLAVENIAAMFEWPDAEMDEAEFISILLRMCPVYLLLDVANLYANCRNFNWNLEYFLRTIPLDRIAYMHLAGGRMVDAFYHDTHAHSVPEEVVVLTRQVAARAQHSGILLERDDHWPSAEVLNKELDLVSSACARGLLHSAGGSSHAC